MDIPPILVINLEERKDRWVNLQNAFQSWRVPLERVEAVRMKPGWKGCSLSHKKCIQIAKDRKYPWVLILEDDCVPEPDCKQRFQALLPSLWARRNEWDIFNGGLTYLFEARVIQEEPPLLKVAGWSTQFILIHEGAYDHLLAAIHEDMKIDVYYKEKERSLCTVPHLAKQAPGISNIENKETDYLNNFERSEETLFVKLFLYKWDFIPRTVAGLLLTGAAVGLLMRFAGKSRFRR
jgi:hypothetical protein